MVIKWFFFTVIVLVYHTWSSTIRRRSKLVRVLNDTGGSYRAVASNISSLEIYMVTEVYEYMFILSTEILCMCQRKNIENVFWFGFKSCNEGHKLLIC